jgi:hypothetical protein
VDTREYTGIFPDKGSLDTFSKISEILMSLHGIKVRIMKSNMDPDASDMCFSQHGSRFTGCLGLLVRERWS